MIHAATAFPLWQLSIPHSQHASQNTFYCIIHGLGDFEAGARLTPTLFELVISAGWKRSIGGHCILHVPSTESWNIRRLKHERLFNEYVQERYSSLDRCRPLSKTKAREVEVCAYIAENLFDMWYQVFQNWKLLSALPSQGSCFTQTSSFQANVSGDGNGDQWKGAYRLPRCIAFCWFSSWWSWRSQRLSAKSADTLRTWNICNRLNNAQSF